MIHIPPLQPALRQSGNMYPVPEFSQCSFEGDSSFGGSGTDILDAACHYRLNSQRLSELNAAYELLNR